MSQHTAAAIVQDISKLITEIYPVAGTGSVNPATLYQARVDIPNLCTELMRVVLGPANYTLLLAGGSQTSSALGFIVTLDIPDIIGDAQVSLLELSEKTGAQAKFIGMAMSCLLKHGYFHEIGGFGAEVYANNEMSNVLRKEHPEIVKNTVGFWCDEGIKSLTRLTDAAMLKGGTVEGSDATPSAAKLAYGFEKTLFEWLQDQPWRGQRMGKAMQEISRIINGNVPTEYSWSKLLSPIVDVGGGIGSLELALFEHSENASLQFTIFDIPGTIEDAKKLWQAQPPEGSSRVSFIAGDFLAASLAETKLPVGLPTYVIRHVLVDWTDDQIVAILRNVKAAMTAVPSPVVQKLVICDLLLHESSSQFVHATSVQILALNNGLIRAEGRMVALVEKSGFRVQTVHHMPAADSIIEAVPLA